ncbi:NAD-dependent epimerase/dehydratase family protein [bacterium]|nr:MAG: NAD-dependent epimerase/dehydratase family protein [bacterium]
MDLGAQHQGDLRPADGLRVPVHGQALKVLLTGANGFLGAALRRRLARGHAVTSVVRPGKAAPELCWDAGDAAGAAALVGRHKPELVVHCAAQAKPDPCEADPAGTRAVNVAGAAALAEAAAAAGARFFFFSSDQVHDGRTGLYEDDSPASPLSEYGRQKRDAEDAVLAAGGDALVFRLALCFGFSPPGAPPNWIDDMRAALAAGRPVRVFTDQKRSALAVTDAAELVARAAAKPGTPEGRRLLNLAGPAPVSRAEFGEAFCAAFGFDPALLARAKAAESPMAAPRPLDCSLQGARLHAWAGFTPAPVREALARLARGA